MKDEHRPHRVGRAMNALFVLALNDQELFSPEDLVLIDQTYAMLAAIDRRLATDDTDLRSGGAA